MSLMVFKLTLTSDGFKLWMHIGIRRAIADSSSASINFHVLMNWTLIRLWRWSVQFVLFGLSAFMSLVRKLRIVASDEGCVVKTGSVLIMSIDSLNSEVRVSFSAKLDLFSVDCRGSWISFSDVYSIVHFSASSKLTLANAVCQLSMHLN